MGTPVFAVPSLEALVQNDYAPVAVVTSPEMPERRGTGTVPTPVKAAALRLGIPTILEPASVKDPALAEAMAALEPDVIVVVAFKILPPAVFTTARRGAFNLHGSLLPRYRGAAPINRAVLSGDTETGVTTFFLKEKVDTGAIILQKRMSIGPDETAGEVHDRMMHRGAEAVIETLQRIEAGPVETIPQDEALASAAPKLFREEGRIDWHLPARTVHNHIRGFSPIPCAWTLNPNAGTTLKLYRSRLAEGTGEPGTVLEAGPRLVVACGEGAVEVLELQPEDRRRMEAAAFLRGHPVRPGDRWG